MPSNIRFSPFGWIEADVESAVRHLVGVLVVSPSLCLVLVVVHKELP